MPLKPCPKRRGFSPGPFIASQTIPGLKANQSAALLADINDPPLS